LHKTAAPDFPEEEDMRYAVRGWFVLSVLIWSAQAAGQAEFPSRQIRLITPFAPGGAIDVLTRTIAERLSIRFGQPVVVDAIPGASTIIGTQALLKAPADGHTFMITTMSTAVNNPVMYQKLPYDPVKDLAPITQLSYGSVLLVAPGNAAYKDVKGFIEWARGQNRPISYGSWGIGTSGHLYGQILKRDYGVNLNHVPYKGDVSAIVDVRNGNLDLTFASPTSAKPQLAGGQIKALGMTGPRRSDALPDLPTFSEQGVPGFELPVWVGVYAPGGTPKAALERIQRELKAVVSEADITRRMLEQGQAPIANTPDEFNASFKTDFPKWEALIRASGAKAE
jgi:tripartite-type tricarboxylate transporter receptor subunit TctC